MILGAISLTGNTDPHKVLNTITDRIWQKNISFEEITHIDFTGGYFLNRRLPYEHPDFLYSDETNDIFVLFSGVLYNKAELPGYSRDINQTTAPELIAELFLGEGPEFVSKLNGDFAFLIYRSRGKDVFLYRDHVGIRPIAYAYLDHTLFFSSDIVGLCSGISQDGSLDSEFLLGYFKYIDYRKTPDHRVVKLLPGHFLHFSEKGITITKYWKPEKIKINRRLSHNAMLSDLERIVRDAVNIRCDGRFNAGAHATGGLDSGIVSILARKNYLEQEVFYGFSWSPDNWTPSNIRYDEREIITNSCRKTDITPVFSGMSRAELMDYVSAFYQNRGYFSEDKTSDQAVALNVNLIFSGWGGDEFISTGDRGIDTDLLTGFKWKAFFRRNSINKPRKFVRYLITYIIYPALNILDRDTAQSFRDDARYIKTEFKKSDNRALKDFYSYLSRRQLHLKLLHFYHLQERCESWVISGYRKGIEYRFPLLDKRIIEYMLTVPSDLIGRTNQYRPLLREVGAYILPEEIRLNLHKTDPVYWSHMADLFMDLASCFMREAEAWKRNPDLNFIDFDLLAGDIQLYNKDTLTSEGKKVLYRAVVYIKAIHEFTITYRGKTEKTSIFESDSLM